jgi:hypothetical protein
MPNYQGVWSLSEQYQNASGWPSPPFTGTAYAFFSSGYDFNTNTRYAQIDQVTTSGGTASDFGDLTVARYLAGTCASLTRALWAGGSTGSVSDVIDFITVSSAGNATDFGNLLSGNAGGVAGCNSGTRGVFGGGSGDVIQYITIASAGNALDFGNLATSVDYTSSCSSSTKGLWGGGDASGNTNVIQSVTISTLGNASDFGDLTRTTRDAAACSSSTRGLFAGGQSFSNVIDYVTIATDGNASDFGDLLAGNQTLGAAAQNTDAVFGGGLLSGSVLTNTVQKVSFATLGNTTDFADLNNAQYYLSGCGNANGGTV